MAVVGKKDNEILETSNIENLRFFGLENHGGTVGDELMKGATFDKFKDKLGRAVGTQFNYVGDPANLPPHLKVCDGSLVLKTLYPALSTALNGKYGGSATHEKLPTKSTIIQNGFELADTANAVYDPMTAAAQVFIPNPNYTDSEGNPAILEEVEIEVRDSAGNLVTLQSLYNMRFDFTGTALDIDYFDFKAYPLNDNGKFTVPGSEIAAGISADTTLNNIPMYAFNFEKGKTTAIELTPVIVVS